MVHLSSAFERAKEVEELQLVVFVDALARVDDFDEELGLRPIVRHEHLYLAV